MSSLYPGRYFCMFIAILLLLNLRSVNANAQLNNAQESAVLAQTQTSPAALASPPGFAPVHLLVFFQPRYTVVTPALFDISGKGSSGNNNGIPEKNTAPKGKPVAASPVQYQPLPASVAAKPSNTYSTLPMMPRSNVPLPGSQVKIPAPLKNNNKKSNYDIAPPKFNRDKAILGGNNVAASKASNVTYGKLPVSLGKNPSFTGNRIPTSKPLSGTGSVANNTSPVSKTSTTASANGGYQPLPGKSNVPLPGNNVAIPRPFVVPGSQRSDGSFKTATSTMPGSGTINNTGTTTSSSSGQKYVSAPPPPGQSAKTTIIHQYDKVPAASKGYESSTQPLSGTKSSTYQTLPLKNGGYESSTQPLSRTPGSKGNQTSPAKNRGYDKVSTTPAGYDNAPSPLKNYQSVTSPLSKTSSTKSTAAQTTVIKDYQSKVPVPTNVKPFSRPNTGVYVSAPKTNTSVATPSTKGATEVKRGALTQGSNTKGTLQVSKATLDKAKADKAQEAAKQKAATQRKAAAIRSTRKGINKNIFKNC